MDEQDKKTVDVKNLSDEELDELAGGIHAPLDQRKKFRKFLERGGTVEEWQQKLKNRPFRY